jgi:DNA polymerase-3 subunit delta
VKLRVDQLHNRSGGTPANVYLIAGDEPLLQDEALAWVRATVRAAGITERESLAAAKGFDWDAAVAGLANLSLFSAGKLLELRLPGTAPGEDGARVIAAALAAPAGNVLAVVTPALDKRARESRWVTAIAADGVWIDATPPPAEALPGWLSGRLKRAGLGIDAAGLELLVACVEGNLLAARQEIDKLALLHPAGTQLSFGDVQAAVADGARFDVFQLADAAVAGDVARSVRILAGLREEGIAPPLVLWSLVREILTLLNVAGRAGRGTALADAVTAAGVWRSRAGLVTGALRRQPAGALTRLVGMARRADQVVKGARRGDPWLALHELTLQLAGAESPVAELS